MKLINDIYIIGLDHGYGNMKTANHIFPTGLLAFDQLPTFTDNLLIWQSRYYLIGTGHNVKYTVSSKFLPSKEGKTFHDRIKRSVVSDFTHLHLLEKGSTINAENVCLTAGEEDECSRRKRKNRSALMRCTAASAVTMEQRGIVIV